MLLTFSCYSDQQKLVELSVRYLLGYIVFYRADEVQAIISGKLALKYSGPAVEAMKSIATASHKRSLADFQKVSVLQRCAARWKQSYPFQMILAFRLYTLLVFQRMWKLRKQIQNDVFQSFVQGFILQIKEEIFVPLTNEIRLGGYWSHQAVGLLVKYCIPNSFNCLNSTSK